ncbi:MAG: hypothetical protein NPIRA06_05640 [Nitrospirales bacterium]|nr:MAG: hypothetical protein NPIRA06_05640 [Nitrospirales bacterium]
MSLLHGVWWGTPGYQSVWNVGLGIGVSSADSAFRFRTIDGPIEKQLGLSNVAPHAELEKIISVRLQNEPLPRALSKIPTLWDYAISLNAVGNNIRLHVMTKVVSELS